MKERGSERPTEGFRAIHMPSNTGTGFILAGIALVLGFAMVWHIWWLAALSFAGLIVTAIAHTFNYRRDHHIPVDEVVRTEAAPDRKSVVWGTRGSVRVDLG